MPFITNFTATFSNMQNVIFVDSNRSINLTRILFKKKTKNTLTYAVNWFYFIL